MSFIEELYNSIVDSLTESLNNLSELELKHNFCIGSGSCFNVYKNITWSQAKKIYKDMGVFHCVGTRILKKESLNTLFEKYHCMESNSGYVSCFIFEIDNIIEDINCEKKDLL